MTITIRLSLPPKTLQPNARPHWRAKAAAAARYRKLAAFVALSALGRNPRPRWARAVARVVWGFACRRRRDQDNLLASLKPAFDGLTDAGILADDVGLSHEAPNIGIVTRGQEFVAITIHPTP